MNTCKKTLQNTSIEDLEAGALAYFPKGTKAQEMWNTFIKKNSILMDYNLARLIFKKANNQPILCVNYLVSLDEIYRSERGVMYSGDCKTILESELLKTYEKKVNLIFTSPPFPLNRRKAYGNLTGSNYKKWLSGFAEPLKKMLTDDGSIVIELGNAWELNNPSMSTLSIETLLEFKKKGNFYLCQEFIYHNPARLPSPVQWVNIERIRVKDAFTRLWWLSTTPKPKADNRHILQDYSKRMKTLLKTKKYNSGPRPSGNVIGKTSFLKNNGGSIPSNVISIPNTSSDPYTKSGKNYLLKKHPARMPIELAQFFIKFLTDEGDIVMDPFAGSNITGYAAEKLKRNWISIEIQKEYAISSISRFNSQSHYDNS